MKRKTLYFFAWCLLLLSSCTAKDARQASYDDVVRYCDGKIHLTMSQMSCHDSMPRNLQGDATAWNLRANTPMEWCSGFWDGCLWYDYALTGDTDVLQAATETASSMLYLSNAPLFDHDLGFLTITSLLNGYRLSPDSLTQSVYREALLSCADSLALLFNPKVGTLLSWPRNVEIFGGHNTIMDNMINLELLFWAAAETGRQDLFEMAVSHADTTMAYHFRPDGTCYHVAVYDPQSGAHLRNCTHQGYADESVWARGQAWAIYGYTMVYRYTHAERHLLMAEKAADAYLRLLNAQTGVSHEPSASSDYVPYWDFCDPAIPNACVVMSALLELQQYADEAKADEYKKAIDKTFASLVADYRTADTCPAILAHSTGHHPAGSEIDYSIIYADYYFLEALYRMKIR